MKGYKKRKWVVKPQEPKIRDLIQRGLNISAVTAQVIANRGMKDVESARRFFKPRLEYLVEPEKLPNIIPAVARINRALQKNEKITIYGDYDVDGITGAALLKNYFKLLNRDLDVYIPERITEGYSLNKGAIDKIKESGTKVLITVDCGTSDVEEIAYANERGIDVIVLDHHPPGNTLPHAYAIVNPKLDGGYQTEISGVGVAFKLCWALSQSFSNAKKLSDEFRRFLIDGVAFVTLGTVADVVPLLEENRIFVSYGLAVLKKTSNAGIKTLIKKCGLEGKKIEASDISFILGPRINASGRLKSALMCVDMLTTEDEKRASEIANELEKLNRERQRIEDEIVENAIELAYKQNDVKNCKVIVIANEEWHIGVIGIVASKVVEYFHKPAVIISIEGEKGKGSARSDGQINIHDAFSHCKKKGVITEGGGHSKAGGLEVESKNIPLFRKEINDFAEKNFVEHDTWSKLIIDTEISLGGITTEIVKELEMLGPFGIGNPRPVFASSNVRICGQPRLIGRKSEHLVVNLLQGSRLIRAVGFGMAEVLQELQFTSDSVVCVAYTPKLNYYWGTEDVELELQDIKKVDE